MSPVPPKERSSDIRNYAYLPKYRRIELVKNMKLHVNENDLLYAL
jgi:hypothetical protein